MVLIAIFWLAGNLLLVTVITQLLTEKLNSLEIIFRATIDMKNEKSHGKLDRLG